MSMDDVGRKSPAITLPPRTAPLHFAQFVVDLDGRALSRADGGAVDLTRGEFALLSEFVRHPGRVLSRDYLLEVLAGRPADSFDRSIDVLVGRLRRKIEPDPKRPDFIKTVPGGGYKFATAIEARPATRASATAADLSSTPREPVAPRLSIVVLPFANITGDAEQDYFVDGLTENLTADLSQIKGAFVIGSNTAFTYKDKPVDLKQVGHELNVRYVLEGGVQRAGNRMRVGVRLIETESGAQLWADRFDKPLADLFEMQDEIVARLANALDAQLVAAEAGRAERAQNPDAIDYCFRGAAWLNKGLTLEAFAEARRLFELALALDPSSTMAQVGLAAVDVTAAVRFLDGRGGRLAVAEETLMKALSAAPEDAYAHYLLGVVQMHTGRAAEGLEECQRALELNRNLAMAHGHIGFAKYQLGRAEETEAHILEALRQSPRDPRVHIWCMFAGAALQYLGRDEEAAVWLRRSIVGNRNNPMSCFLLAAALVNLGQIDEARAQAAKGLSLNPAFTVMRIRATFDPGGAHAASAWERFYQGLRAAGVPEE